MKPRTCRSAALTCAFAFLAALGSSQICQAQGYRQTNLVTGSADSLLQNPWGLSRSSTSPWWVADNTTGVSTLYDGTGKKIALTVSVPGMPTATIFNPATMAFAPSGTTAGSRFLFVSLDGKISGWNTGTNAQVLTATAGAIYTGATAATVNGQRYLYAADFHNARVDVFDSKLAPAAMGSAAFHAPSLEQQGYAPFNIQNIGGTLFVTFSKQDANKQFDVHGAGLGYLVSFTRTGQMIQTYEHGDWFNSAWGLALAPSDFGVFSHDLLVGMFGSGQVAAFNVVTGRFEGLLEDTSGKPIAIPGLWALGFGNGAGAGPLNTLYFTAGPSPSTGIFGTLTVAQGQVNFGSAR